jgi:hypothetical protein
VESRIETPKKNHIQSVHRKRLWVKNVADGENGKNDAEEPEPVGRR